MEVPTKIIDGFESFTGLHVREKLMDQKTEMSTKPVLYKNSSVTTAWTYFKKTISSIAKLAGSAIAGAVITHKMSQFIDHPELDPSDCKKEFTFIFDVYECRNRNYERAFALGIGLPVLATAIHVLKSKQQQSRIRKILNATLFGIVYGGSVGAAFGGDTKFDVPSWYFGPIVIARKEEAVPNYLLGAALGGVIGFTAEVAKQILFFRFKK